MKAFELPAALFIGYPPIDDDHRQLVARLNEVVAAMSREPREAWPDLIAGFFDAFADHMDRENAWFMEVGYPDWSDHRSAHKGIRARMDAMLANIRAGGFARNDLETIVQEGIYLFLEDAIREDVKAKSFFFERR